MNDSLIIAAYEKPDDARTAVDRVAATGLPKHDIVLVVSDDELFDLPEEKLIRECDIVHTSTYDEIARNGGALGAVLGMLMGSLVALNVGAENWSFAYSLIVAGATGFLLGGGASYLLPHLHSKAVRHVLNMMDRSGYRYSSHRLLFAGATGGFYGALIGCSACYGISGESLYFFWSIGLIAAVIVGGLLGSIRGFVLQSEIPFHERDLGDPVHRVLVSIDCKHCAAGRQNEILQLLRV